MYGLPCNMKSSSPKTRQTSFLFLKPLQMQNLKKKVGGTWHILLPPSEKVGGHVPRVPHQIAPMHRAMITPFSPLLTRLIHISPSSWTLDNLSFVWFYSRSGNCFLDWTSNPIQCSIQIHCFKKHSVRYEICFKDT